MNVGRLAALLAAVLTAGLAWELARRAVAPRRSPQLRIAPFVERARAQLGAGTPASAAQLPGRVVLGRVVGPMVAGAVDALARAALLTPADRLELALRQAGMRADVDAFRRSCVYWLAGAPVLAGLAGTVTGNATCVAAFFVLGIFVGVRRGRERLAAGRRRRNEKLRTDLPTVAAALAVKIDNNRSLFVALSDLVERGDGPVLEDLARALHLAAAGYGEAAAFALVAQESAEPAAARFYRLLAVATNGGTELSKALLDQANDLRRQRREEVERSAGRRQMALVVPSMVFMAPVLFAFMLAPLPALLFAR